MAVTKHEGNGIEIKVRRTQKTLDSAGMDKIVPAHGEIYFIDGASANSTYLMVGSKTKSEKTGSELTLTELPRFKADKPDMANKHVYYYQYNKNQLIDEDNQWIYPQTKSENVSYQDTTVKNQLDTLSSKKYAGVVKGDPDEGRAKGLGVTQITTNNSNDKYFVLTQKLNDKDGAVQYFSTGNGTDGVYINGKTGVLYGAAWNDFAESRKCTEKAGTCVREVGDGSLEKTTERLQAGCSVVSDTFGMVIGKEEKGYKPVAVAGRVLVYVDNKDEIKNHIGEAVCSGKNGTVSLMTRQEIINYPDRIVGYISEIPTHKTWNGVEIDGRVWIKIK